MPDYKKMYFELFNAVTTAIDRLQAAQCNGENTYIESDRIPLVIRPDSADKKPQADE